MASQGAHPACLFLTLTLLVTIAATSIMVSAILTPHWEEVSFDKKTVEEITHTRNQTHKLTWLMEGEVAKVEISQNHSRHLESFSRHPLIGGKWPPVFKAMPVPKRGSQGPRVIFLVPTHAGIWTLCLSLSEKDQGSLRKMGFPYEGCINFLEDGGGFGESASNEWIQRMQNMSISCSLVCCIVLGASFLVGIFGVIQRQISAVLITGVMYILATIFGLFCLSIMHFKRKTKRECSVVDPQITVEFARARIIEIGWSLEMGWMGIPACLGAAVLWILLAKVMRISPIALS